MYKTEAYRDIAMLSEVLGHQQVQVQGPRWLQRHSRYQIQAMYMAEAYRDTAMPIEVRGRQQLPRVGRGRDLRHPIVTASLPRRVRAALFAHRTILQVYHYPQRPRLLWRT